MHLIFTAHRFTFLLVSTCLLFGLLGCGSEEEEPAPISDEWVSFKVNGKDYKGNASFLGSDTYFQLWGVAELSSTEGYSIQMEMSKPKVGTFTAAKDGLKASVTLLKGTVLNPTIKDYNLPSNGTGTITFSQYDAKGYAKGTFSFTGVNDSGQRLQVTDGKFQLDLQ